MNDNFPPPWEKLPLLRPTRAPQFTTGDVLAGIGVALVAFATFSVILLWLQ